MTNQLKNSFISSALLLAAMILIFFLSNFLTNSRPIMSESYEDEDLALQSARLKNYSLGFDGLIADWYWMQSLQYIGNKVINADQNISIDDLRSVNPRLLYPLLDNATDLDPHFTAAYSYGAVVLPAIDAQQAIKIAEKGINNNPDEWRFYQHLGYIYWRLGDFAKASETYEKGSQIQDAPPFFRLMAAYMKGQGGSREAARAIYLQMFKEAQDSQTKEAADIRLKQLQAFDEVDVTNKVLQDFKAKNNRCVNNFSEIFPLLKAVKLPDGKDFSVDKSSNLVDPTGAAYLLDKENCAIKIDFTKSNIPLQ